MSDFTTRHAEPPVHFSKHLFWDIDRSRLDYKEDRELIIERVLVYGNEDDERQLYDLYSKNVIKKVAIKSENLNARTVSYLSTIMDIPEEKFKCYKRNVSYRDY
jgi:hypothetical protein